MARFFEAQDILVSELFNGKKRYAVPLLQRRYVWNQDSITALLEDIRDSRESSDAASFYFIGATVFARETAGASDGEPLMVIDGQQRLTTLCMALSVAAKRFHAAAASTEVAVEKRRIYSEQAEHYEDMISSKIQDIRSGTLQRSIVLQLHKSDDSLFQRLMREGISGVPGTGLSVSQRNLRDGMETICSFFDEYLSDPDDLMQYMAYLANRVVIVETIADDPSTAFLIFETINDRGTQGLEPEDLLKNELLKQVDGNVDASLDQFGVKWDAFISQLTRPNGSYVVKPSTFLKHFIMSRGVYIKKEGIYAWFRTANLDVPVLDFLDQLTNTAQYYRELVEGRVPGHAAALRKLGFRQAYVVLLAVMGLSAPDRDSVARVLEAIACEYVFTGGKTSDLERKFSAISGAFAAGEDAVAVRTEAILNELKRIAVDKRESFRQALATYRLRPSSSGDRRKVKYLLTRMAAALDGGDFEGYEIEHVMPEAATPADYGMTEKAFAEHVHHLGNLALLPKGANAAASSSKFAAKRSIFQQASCRLTRSLSEELSTGTKATQHDKAVAAFSYRPPADSVWDAKAIQNRAQAYSRLMLHALDLEVAIR